MLKAIVLQAQTSFENPVAQVAAHKESKHMKLEQKITMSAAAIALAFALPATLLAQDVPGHKFKKQPMETLAVTYNPAAAGHQIPKFHVDPDWPQIPNGWTLGQVASAASDPQTGHIWISQRYRVIRPWEKAAPPIMEFDQSGKYIQGWGGPAPEGAPYKWPRSEHGIMIDFKGNVWVGGNGDDDEIMKFTKDGKFLSQIGTAHKPKSNKDTDQFWKPADFVVDPKTNELYVADGYGNRRVIVFDAETGAYKRMWGAFGNPPVDPEKPVTGGEGGPPRREPADPNRIPAKDLADDDQGPDHFDTVHGVKVSNDGLVYVADRKGKRVQIFTTAGKYVNQIWDDRFCEAPGGTNLMCGNGETAASVAFSGDPEQKFLYIASRSPDRILIYERKSMLYLGSFGGMGVKPGQFYGLHHMTTDTKGNLYVSEVEDGRRVQKFVFDGTISVPK